KPGMFGRISIVYDLHENVLQVPRNAILEESTQTSVFVVEDNKAIRKVVQTGYSDKGMVEITSGLTDDDLVVTVGQIGLKDDSAVTIINTDGQAMETIGDDAEQADNDAPTD
ncbi:MAG: efflux transporter periplasmic adaptor subunit, partial [Gammaproteobacteria bacterium]|nr:efflux transporter periplasmic adaptor subunit [Gammaproteobacteria bacterium]